MSAIRLTALLPSILALAAAGSARADGDPGLPRTVPPAYAQECASCHVPFPPGMLPARSWQRLMGGLDRHFGTDASLDAATVREIESWLRSNAGTWRRDADGPPQDRITRSAWFEREHRKVGAAARRSPSAGSAANCGACHPGADLGRFDDEAVRRPAGSTRLPNPLSRKRRRSTP